MENIENINNDFDLLYNTSKRIPIIFCVDTSGSMRIKDELGKSRIDNIKKGLDLFKYLLNKKKHVRDGVEYGIIGFNDDPYVIHDIANSEQKDNDFECSGKSDICKAIIEAYQILVDRMKTYDEYGIQYDKPYIILITDGYSSGENSVENLSKAKELITNMESKSINLLSLYIGDSYEVDKAMDELKELCNDNPPITMMEGDYIKFFEWLEKQLKNLFSKKEIDFSSIIDWDKM